MFNKDFFEIIGDAMDEVAEWFAYETDTQDEDPWADLNNFEAALMTNAIFAIG